MMQSYEPRRNRMINYEKYLVQVGRGGVEGRGGWGEFGGWGGLPPHVQM